MRIHILAAAAVAGCALNSAPYTSSRSRSMSGWRHRGQGVFLRLTATRAAAVLEERRTRIPRDEHRIAFTSDELERHLTRSPFTNEVWGISSGLLNTLVVDVLEGQPHGDSIYLPLSHCASLALIARLSERCRQSDLSHQGGGDSRGQHKRGVPQHMYPSLKYCIKKHGLGKAAMDVSEGFCPTYETPHSQREAMVSVERCLAEFCLVWSTARLLEACAPPETKRDFVFHLRAVMEHAPARDRVHAVAVLCRGLFTPGYNQDPFRVQDNVHGAALRSDFGGYPLVDSFAEVQKGAAQTPAALRAARQAYPFLEVMARWAWRCSTTPHELKKGVHSRSNGVAANFLAGADATTAASVSAAWEDGDRIELRGDGTSVAVLEAPVSVGLKEERYQRGISNTGVAALLVALAKADPSGDIIQALQSWVCEAVAPQTRSPGYIIRTSHKLFAESKKVDRVHWMRRCREVGALIHLLVGTLDEQRGQEEGPAKNQRIKSAVNHAMFVTTFSRSIPGGYQRLVAGGRVPGDTKSSSGGRSGATTWLEGAKLLDKEMATVLGLPERTIQSDKFRGGLSALLGTWKAPVLLADYYMMHRKDGQVIRIYRRFLQALLGLSKESVHDIRVRDRSNHEHMRHFPDRVRRLWQAEPSTLSGTADPQIIFRMGQDTRSCMGIRAICVSTNRALLGYLLQGNVRLVYVQSEAGRMEARAVVRLLLREDVMAPVLFMDPVFYSSHPCASLEEQVLLQAKHMSKTLDVPLYRAGDVIPRHPHFEPSPRPEVDGKYCGAREASDTCSNASAAGENSVDGAPQMCRLVEMDGISSWVYSDGVVGEGMTAGMLHRSREAGASRELVLAELRYAPQ